MDVKAPTEVQPGEDWAFVDLPSHLARQLHHISNINLSGPDQSCEELLAEWLRFVTVCSQQQWQCLINSLDDLIALYYIIYSFREEQRTALKAFIDRKEVFPV